MLIQKNADVFQIKFLKGIENFINIGVEKLIS